MLLTIFFELFCKTVGTDGDLMATLPNNTGLWEQNESLLWRLLRVIYEATDDDDNAFIR